MESILLVNLSRQMTMRRTMDVIANNLANMNTTAFKAESVLFKEHLEPVQRGATRDNLSFVIDYGVSRNFEEGQFRPTGNSFDLAISGEGYFVVETDDGPRYTRNGHFKLDAEGQLVTHEGHPVLDQDGRTVLVNTEDVMTVSEDGTINANDEEEPQRLMIATFPNPGSLKKAGTSLFSSDDAPDQAAGAKVLQGTLESSNVSPILEMSRMIETTRAYQRASDTEEKTGELARKAIERLGRVQS